MGATCESRLPTNTGFAPPRTVNDFARSESYIENDALVRHILSCTSNRPRTALNPPFEESYVTPRIAESAAETRPRVRSVADRISLARCSFGLASSQRSDVARA